MSVIDALMVIIALAVSGYVIAAIAAWLYYFLNGAERLRKAAILSFVISFGIAALALIIHLFRHIDIPFMLIFLVMSNGLFLSIMAKEKIQGVITLIAPINILLLLAHAFIECRGGSATALPSSPWFYLHLTAFLFSYASFTVAALCSILYLYQARRLKRKKLDGAFLRLPSLKSLDIASYRFIGFGFPFLVLGILFGSIWSHVHWGAYWVIRPGSITAMLITLIYLACVHIRMINRWQGVKINIMLVAAFLLMLLSILGMGHIPGLHW